MIFSTSRNIFFWVTKKLEKYIELHIVKKISKELSFTLIVADLSLEIVSGGLLTGLKDFYYLLPGLFLILPGLMELRGNISSNLAQRLGTALHLGIINWDDKFNDESKENIKAAILSTIINSTALGIGAYLITVLIGYRALTLFAFVFIAVTTAMLSSTLQIFVTLYTALYTHRKGYDPDNIVIPIVTSLNDITIVFILLLVIRLTLALSVWIPLLQ